MVWGCRDGPAWVYCGCRLLRDHAADGIGYSGRYHSCQLLWSYHRRHSGQRTGRKRRIPVAMAGRGDEASCQQLGAGTYRVTLRDNKAVASAKTLKSHKMIASRSPWSSKKMLDVLTILVDACLSRWMGDERLICSLGHMAPTGLSPMS